MRALLLGLILTCSTVGCGNTPVPADGGHDTAFDANEPLDAFHSDGGHCDLTCGAGQECCFDLTGTAACVDINNDIHNCGICNRDCVTSRRGDSCAHAQCGCGDFEIGCTGAANSVCCPSVSGIRAYCANPGLDLSDCGGCGHSCNSGQASLCSGGLCFCGDTGGPCDGTATSLCCSDPAGAFECVDTTNSQAHCGGCGQRCSAFEHCVSSHCVSTLMDGGA